jgi:hypothetical protein
LPGAKSSKTYAANEQLTLEHAKRSAMLDFNSMIDCQHWAEEVDVMIGRNLKESIEGKNIDLSQRKVVGRA